MRKVTAILLLSCMVLNATGLSAFFIIQKAWLRQEMRALITKPDIVKSTKIQTIIIDPNNEDSNANLEWEGSDEFRYGGAMYDVIDKHTENNKLIIHCISDKDETALLNHFRKANEKGSNHQSLQLAKLLSIQFIPATATAVVIAKKQDRVYNNSLPPALQQQPRKILTPPPQSA